MREAIEFMMQSVSEARDERRERRAQRSPKTPRHPRRATFVRPSVLARVSGAGRIARLAH
ncbi:hypothetical protein [Microbacterium sp. C7(2022)]|uniref:hypothetical protein n=1 Tax=Microbacterium sp. C7(2022) TaxID=2992759 RepID=UPI00237C122E|nr:hypothetical protein [Microbacterium sp. C7(2022)]MDE0546531.1 hypothetical protein [Microbacterium sp. C7(2022)]